MSAALVDSGPMVAAFGTKQPQAARFSRLFEQAALEGWPLSTTWPCIVEVSHLLAPPRRYTFLRWVGSGAVNVFPIDPAQLDEIAELMHRYTEAPRTEMDLADASLVWLAADISITRVMTMDERDFSRYRLPDGRAFEIL